MPIATTPTDNNTSFNSFHVAVNDAKSHALADPSVPMSAWIAPYAAADAALDLVLQEPTA